MSSPCSVPTSKYIDVYITRKQPVSGPYGARIYIYIIDGRNRCEELVLSRIRIVYLTPLGGGNPLECVLCQERLTVSHVLV